MPYMLSDEHFIFGDVRGFTSTHSRLGGSAGLGYRYLLQDMNAWGGASVWYDADDTTSKLFQQIGLTSQQTVDDDLGAQHEIIVATVLDRYPNCSIRVML